MEYRVVIKGTEPPGKFRKSEKRMKMWDKYEVSIWLTKHPRLKNPVKYIFPRSLNPDE